MATKKTPEVTVKRNEENPEPMEIIAKSIIDIAAAFKKLENSRLQSRAILLLLKDATGISMGEIDKVLKAAANLEKTYIKSAKK